MLTFVIARFEEDIGWVNQLPADARIFVYNKGAAIEAGILRRNDVQVIALKDAGRQSGTYLQHMMTGFDAGAAEDFTVFTGGDPFACAPHFLDLIEVSQRWRDVQPLALQRPSGTGIPPARLAEEDQRDWIDDLPVRPEHFSLGTWAPLAFDDDVARENGRAYRQKHLLPEGSNLARHFLEFVGLDELAAQAGAADIGVFSYGAIFAVRNRRIAGFLQTGRRHLGKMEILARADPDCDGIYERLWLHLFGEPFITLSALSAGTTTASETAVRATAASAVPVPGRTNPQLRHAAYVAGSAGRIDEAISLLQTALGTDPEDADALSDLATLALGAGDQPAAMIFAEHALRIRPSHGAATYVRAMCALGQGDAPTCLSLLETLQSGEPALQLHAEAPELVAVVQQSIERLRGLGRAARQQASAAATS